MVRELQRPSFWKAVLAEFLGMTIFVFLSTGSATKWTPSGYPADIVQISLTFGLAIATMAQSLGHLSGGHLNPAVTLGLLAGCQVSLLRALLYIASQLLGAVAASALLLGVTPASRNSTLGLNAVSTFTLLKAVNTTGSWWGPQRARGAGLENVSLERGCHCARVEMSV
ncbi:aquaporin-2-like [Chiloscyllium plagiosum]|uniref:aquaporin-2-like n=1 Tax=Chiloscyllium plagiosum TaxID=36176 RepID=UPI001CB82253|nr:aquaporin-2-like [Chiloscyllium plagiosum]